MQGKFYTHFIETQKECIREASWWELRKKVDDNVAATSKEVLHKISDRAEGVKGPPSTRTIIGKF